MTIAIEDKNGKYLGMTMLSVVRGKPYYGQKFTDDRGRFFQTYEEAVDYVRDRKPKQIPPLQQSA